MNVSRRLLRLRRLLAPLAVAGCLLASLSLGTLTTSASAARPAAAATDVFTGTVMARTHVKRPIWAYTVVVQQVFDGGIRSARVQVKTLRSFEPCARTPLRVGTAYAFSLTRVSETFEASRCADIVVANAAAVSSLTARYGTPRAPVISPRPPGQALPAVVLTPVDAGSPASFTRVAAPGLALVIVGLLGFAVARRVARAR